MMDLPATLATIWKELHPHIKRALDLWERQLNQEPLVVENQISLSDEYNEKIETRVYTFCPNCKKRDDPAAPCESCMKHNFNLYESY